MTYTNTLGALLQGVSQQPAAVRPQGRVTEQINFVSDVVQGLTARPATRHVAEITGEVEGKKFFDASIDGFEYIIGYSAGALSVWDNGGAVWPITYEDAAAQAYIGADLRGYVHDSTLYVTNRDVVTATAATAAPRPDVYRHSAFVTCLGGKYSRTYKVSLFYPSDGSTAIGTYTTPDGTTAGDADKTASNSIVAELHASLAASPQFKPASILGRQDNVLLIKHTSKVEISASDGEDGGLLRAHAATADSIETLSEYAPQGAVVRITGSDAGAADDYWLRFTISGSTPVGSGFGMEGVWEETTDPDAINDFDLTTMPHVLEWNGTGFTFRRGTWLPRRTGDGETNEFPDFIGHAIRDISGFQSRLVFAAGPYCVMSRTNKALDFFKSSATVDLATDPISIASTKEGKTRLDWIVPFDRNLLFMSDPGSGQFVISGNDLLTPSGASIAQTTAFEMRGGASPVQTGRTVLFPFKTGKYSGVKEFFTNDEVATNGADTLTETLDRYIEGLVNHMACSTNLNTVLLKTDAPQVSNVIYVYSYLWQGSEKVQSAWCKWEMPGDVQHFYFTGSEITLVLWHADRAAYSINRADLDLPTDDVVDYHVCLDRKQEIVVDPAGTVLLPYAGASLCQSTGCVEVGAEAEATAVAEAGQWRYTVDPDAAPVGATVIAGQKYLRAVKPTMPFMRDNTGNVRAQSHVVVTAFFIDYRDIGALDTVFSSPYRDTYTFGVNFFPLGDTPGTGPSGLQSGILEVPWGERSDWSELTIQSDDIRPTTILEVEWAGQPFNR